MSAESAKFSPWDSLIGYDEATLHARTEAINAAIDAGLTAFDRHKDELLNMLRKFASKTTPFDANESWRSLRFVALAHFWKESQGQLDQVMTATDRINQLKQIENALYKARFLIKKAMPDQVGVDLFWAWYEASSAYNDEDPMGPLYQAQIEFSKVVAALVTLEAAAFRASGEVCSAPKGRNIPPELILQLETAYREITGKPAGIPGRFTRFVGKVLNALGRETDQAVIEQASRYVRTCEEKHPTTSRWGRSRPFFGGLGGKPPSCSK